MTNIVSSMQPLHALHAVANFRRIWTDGGALTGGEGVSIWRPIAPPGYVSLGALRQSFKFRVLPFMAGSGWAEAS